MRGGKKKNSLCLVFHSQHINVWFIFHADFHFRISSTKVISSITLKYAASWYIKFTVNRVFKEKTYLFWICIFFIYTHFLSGMSRREKFSWQQHIPKLPLKITSAPHPMNHHLVDETPLPCLWHSHFHGRALSFCQTSLQSMPKHFPCTVFFMTLFHSQKANEPSNADWKWRGLRGCGVGGNRLSQVKSAEQPTDFSPTYIFILMTVDCHRAAAVLPPLNFTSSFLTPIRKVHFPCPIFLKVSLPISHSGRFTPVFPICILKAKTDTGRMVRTHCYDPTKSTHWEVTLKRWFKKAAHCRRGT